MLNPCSYRLIKTGDPVLGIEMKPYRYNWICIYQSGKAPI